VSLDVVDDGDDTEGVERLELALSSDSAVAAAPSRFTLWILDSDTAQAPIAEGDSSGTLVSALQQRYADPPTLGYDRARDSLYRRLYNEQDTVETIYSGLRVRVDADGGDASDQALDENVNTEHVWPRSRGAETEPALSNLHILAPARDAVNSARSNYAFGEIPDDETDTWYFKDQSRSTPPSSNAAAWTEVDDSPSDRADRRFEPRHSVKGDVARAVFYFAMAYPNRADLSFFDAQRETLLEWHRRDPVDATELRRTLRIATYQGNTPNPFVLDSTLAGRAYGKGVPEPEAISIQQARDQGSGTVTIEGVVTRVGENGPYLQDDTGGIYIFESEGAFGEDLGDTIQRGTRLEVTGTLTYFNGLLELTEIPDSGYEVLAQDESLPSAQVVTLGEIASNGEEYEAEIVRVENVSIEADGEDTFQAGGGGNYTIRDGTGSLTLRVPGGSALDGAPIPKLATFRGPLGQFNTEGAGADEPDTGYQLLAVAEGDLEGKLSGETGFDIARSFGDPSTGDSYRLVALPGQVDRDLSSTLSGDNGIAWEAYWDDGSEEDFLVKFDGSDTFTLRPGRGFWLLNTGDWSVSDTVSTVAVEGGTATVSLQEGWNILSNPLPTDVSWSAVTEANGGSLQALWRWTDGGFQQIDTLASATTGEAFYFLNDQGLDSLSVPVVASGKASTGREAAGLERAVTMVAERSGDAEGRVRVAEHPVAEAGRDSKDLVAPPSRFAKRSLRLRAPFGEDGRSRQSRLARDVRPTGTPGQTYTLVLRADTATTMTLRAASLPRSAQATAALLHPATGEPHNLRTDGGMTVTAGPEGTRVKLLVGTSAYVQGEARAQVPETLTVDEPAPNPFRDQTTLRYALPEKQHVRIVVYDLLGRAVRTLVDGQRDAGPHQVAWTGQAGTQQRLASGTYLLRLSAGGEQHVEKVVLVR